MSLLSVPALTDKGICVLFMPNKALLIDLKDDLRVIGVATKRSDGLFYISERHTQSQSFSEEEHETIRAMMAMAREESSDETRQYMDEEISELLEEEDPEECEERNEDIEQRDVNHGKTEVGAETNIARNTTQGYHKKDVEVWHNRLAHTVTWAGTQNMIKSGLLPSAKCDKVSCDPCTKGKYRRSYTGSLSKAQDFGHLHADVKGPISPTSIDGDQYFLTVVDEYSRFVFAKPLQQKGEASESLLSTVTFFERQSGFSVKSLHTDGGGEFKIARKTLKSLGVNVTGTTAYTPASNGLAERAHGILLSLSRSCLNQAKLPLSYWNYALQHVVAAKNTVQHTVTKQVPYQVLFGTKAKYLKHLRAFGCRTLYAPVKPRQTSFESRLQEGLNLGHQQGGVYHVLTTQGVVRTKHVRMIESEFPGRFSADLDDNKDRIREFEEPRKATEHDSGTIEIDLGKDMDENPVEIDPLTYYPAEMSMFGEKEVEKSTDEANTEIEAPSPVSKEPTPRHEYNLRPRANRTSTFQPLPEAISTSDEPTVKEALQGPERREWLAAIKEEFANLRDSRTWKESNEPVPSGTQVLPSGMILRLKRDEKGKTARFKGRLVARGNFQSREKLFSTDLYAPVACIELVRLLLSISVSFGWSRQQLDIKGAFLYAELPDDLNIWIKLPKIQGIKEANGRIVKLLKSLYGIRQAPKLWYQVLAKILSGLGFRPSAASECLFLLDCNAGRVFLLAYVDDLLLVGTAHLVTKIKEKLGTIFVVTDLGECSFFLGVKVEETTSGLFLSQPAFIERIIKLANMADAKPASFPLPLSHPLYEELTQLSTKEVSEMSNIPYREVLGCLVYLSTRTRPDIATAVSMLGKFQSAPTVKHWKALKNVVRYLIGTKKYGLLLEKGSGKEIQLEAYSDADWARDEDKRRSRTGYGLFVNNSPILWKSKLQSSCALSTCEAEYGALSSCVRDLAWLRSILHDLQLLPGVPTTIYQDNLGTISWTENVVELRRVKHVALKYHYVKDAVENNDINVLYTPSSKNKADSLTKVLVGAPFIQHRIWLQCRTS